MYYRQKACRKFFLQADTLEERKKLVVSKERPKRKIHKTSEKSEGMNDSMWSNCTPLN